MNNIWLKIAGVAVVLVIGAGLMARTFTALTSIEPGFDGDRTVTMAVSLPTTRYPDPASATAFYREVLGEIDHIPGVACPIYVLSGTADQHTPVSETQQMFAAASPPKELWLVDGAAHVDLHRAATVQYEKRVLAFLHRHLRDQDTSQ